MAKTMKDDLRYKKDTVPKWLEGELGDKVLAHLLILNEEGGPQQLLLLIVNPLQKFCERRARSSGANAEDLFSESQVYLEKRLLRYEAKLGMTDSHQLSLFSAYCNYSIAESLRKFHKRRERERAAGDSIVEVAVNAPRSAEESHNEMLTTLMNCLNKLPTKDHQLMNSCYFDKPPKKRNELAAIYKVTVKSIYNRLEKIRARVRECVIQEEE